MNNHLIYNLIENAAGSNGFIQFLDRSGNYDRYSYRDIYEKSKVYASYLIENDVKKGDIVSIMLPTSLEFVASFFGTLLVGGVPTCLYPPTGLANLDQWALRAIRMMNKSNSNHIISDIKISSLFGNRLHKNEKTILLTEKFPTLNTHFHFDIESYKSSDLCFLQFSSGTTGDPKPVMVTNENAITNATIMLEGTGIDPNQVRTVNWAPLYHDMGLVGAFIGTTVACGELTLIRPDDFLRRPKLWLKAIGECRATITAAPNFAFGLCTKRIKDAEVSNFDLSSLQVALCGAEVIYQDTINAFYEKFKTTGLSINALTATYGIAEGTLGVTFASSKEPIRFSTFSKASLASGKPIESEAGVTVCALGKPLRTVGLNIKDDNFNNLQDGRVGQIVISGKSVSSGYYNDLEKTNETIIDGELNTGDEGFIYDGQLYICGRIKDTIIIRGKNYYPTVFEEKLCSIKSLREGRIVVSSLFDETENTEQLIILAEVKSNKFLTNKKEITSQINRMISSMGHKPKLIELYGPRTLPKTTSGKLRRKIAVEMWKADTLVQAKQLSNLDVLKIQIKYFINFISTKNNSSKEKRHA